MGVGRALWPWWNKHTGRDSPRAGNAGTFPSLTGPITFTGLPGFAFLWESHNSVNGPEQTWESPEPLPPPAHTQPPLWTGNTQWGPVSLVSSMGLKHTLTGCRELGAELPSAPQRNAVQ
ncbi:hypothetical protein KIL84_004060 [Mauremys mutica]|uniref:Uncharacterized protein n=1 Tax=Mauremys mutica TaxID=74926 RepID=A0A9D3XMD3_9SAUR|nr:hypothetical protein KIL84_004060 [Mauremys mutica]